jgi:integrase
MTTEAITPLRKRMIEDMNARKLCAGTQRGHILACKRFAAFVKRSPDTASLEDIRRFQLHLADTGISICNRNRIMTGLRFLFRVTLRRLDLAEEVYHIREPEKLALVMSIDEIKRLLAVGSSLKTRVLLGLGYGCGLRAAEIMRLKVKHIDKAQSIIRIEQSKGGKDRNVMLPKEMLGLLRQWWRVRPSRHDAGIPLQERWLFPSTASQFAVAWVLNNALVTGTIAGPRTFEQWEHYLGTLDYKFTIEDEALVDRLVAPGHPSTPGYNDPAYPLEGRVPRSG